MDSSTTGKRIKNCRSKQASHSGGTRSADSRTLLFGSPREVLARISAGDPLRIRTRIGVHLRETHQLFDADRLHLRTLAHSARQASHLRASDGLESFLRARIADAARELCAEDLTEVQSGRGAVSSAQNARSQPAGRKLSKGRSQSQPSQRVQLKGLDELVKPLGLKPDRVRAACALFNELDEAERKACFDLLVDGANIDALAKAEGVTVTLIARRARRALETALGALDGESS